MIDSIKQRRKQAWRDAENASHLEEVILSLATDSDSESAIFALYVKLICLNVTGISEKNSKLGMSFFNFLLSTNSGQSKENTASATRLNEAYKVRCGKAYDIMFAMPELQEGIRKSRLQSSALALAPRSSKEIEAGLTAHSYDAFDRALKDRDLAPVWLAKNFWEFQDVPASKAFLSDLTYEARQAVSWLAICNLGGGCEEGCLTRLNACMTSLLCAANSV